MKIHIFVHKLWIQYCLCFFPLKGFTYCSNITTHRNSRRNCLASCENMLQYLSSQQKSHQSDNSQSHSYSDAKCYLCTHGKPSGEYWGARTPQAFGVVAVKRGFHALSFVDSKASQFLVCFSLHFTNILY